MKCRHCGKPDPNCARRLCYACYHDLAVREKYPPTSKFAARGVGVGVNHRSKLPEEATGALPGSEEKVSVMEARALRGEAVFHPLDRRELP